MAEYNVSQVPSGILTASQSSGKHLEVIGLAKKLARITHQIEGGQDTVT